MKSDIDLTSFERSLWLARSDLQSGAGHALFICQVLGEAIALLSMGGLPVLELTEPATPGCVNAAWQFYFSRRLPMVRNTVALVVQPVSDWGLRRSWALVAALDEDRISVVLEFGEPEPGLVAACSHVLICGAIMPAKPGDAVMPMWTPEVVAAIEGGASPEILAGMEDRSRLAANRAIGAVWTHSVSDFDLSMPSAAEIQFARDRNRTPPQRPHAICGGVSIRLPHFQF